MNPCKILIIDDDEDDIGILSEALAQAGVDQLHYVFSAMQAFIHLQETPADCLPKLIITDLYLPGITGAEFLQDLKKMEKYKDILVVVLSTIKSETEIKRYLELGAADFLHKPNTYEDYLKVAEQIKQKIKG